MRTAAAFIVVGLLLAAPVAATSAGEDLAAGNANRDSASSGTDGQRCPRGDHDGYEARRLIGKTLERARKAARRRDCYVRVVKRNGEYLSVTDDFVVNRINVGVRRRIVKSVHGVH